MGDQAGESGLWGEFEAREGQCWFEVEVGCLRYREQGTQAEDGFHFGGECQIKVPPPRLPEKGGGE